MRENFKRNKILGFLFLGLFIIQCAFEDCQQCIRKKNHKFLRIFLRKISIIYYYYKVDKKRLEPNRINQNKLE